MSDAPEQAADSTASSESTPAAPGLPAFVPGKDTISRTIAAPAEAIFAILADPARHRELDGVRMIQENLTSEPITAVGQVFRMRMSRGAPEDYFINNHVVAFDPPRQIAWTVHDGDTDQDLGWSWTFDLTPTSTSGESGDAAPTTTVSQTYDWTKAIPAVQAFIPFPAISAARRERTLVKLEALVTGVDTTADSTADTTATQSGSSSGSF